MTKFNFASLEKKAEKKSDEKIVRSKKALTKKPLKNLEESIADLPKIKVLQIPMKNIKLDDLDKQSIDVLRDIHKELFGYSAPRKTGYGRIWLSNKIKNSFK